jgi:outer membrane scaffolding protein for murein synthesis (MipA/OmpV family)
VHAQPSTIGSEAAGRPPASWTLDVGPGVVVGPWFEGGAYYRALPIPNLDLRYQRDRFFVSARDGVGATLLDLGEFKAGPILRYRFPRNEWDGPGLYGTGSVPFTVEGGGFVRYDLPFIAAKVELRRGLGGSNGLIFDALIDGKIRLADNLFLSGGPRLSVTDATFNQAYFGINSQQSANSGYAQYYPGAGLRSIGAGASAQWRITEKITAVAFGSYNRLADIAAASPIVSGPAGSPNQFIGGAALTWRFGW